MKKFLIIMSTILLTGLAGALTDTFPRPHKKIDLFPAISYAPETNLTLGVIGYYNFDLAKQSHTTRFSNVNFVAAYTLAKQRIIEFNWDIFTDNNNWRYRGELFINRFPDRNYGLGNEANLVIADIEDDKIDTLNYVRFDSDRIKFSPVVLKRIGDFLFLGLQADLEKLYNFSIIPEAAYPLNEASHRALEFPVEGTRVGIGFNLLYDSRDNLFNPLTGTYFEVNNYFYSGIIGSDYNFSGFRFDGRHYVNPVKNHTLALRGVGSLCFSEDQIPLRALSRVGGKDFIRGYFKGTYQDKHLLAFEMEYRWPFWNQDLTAPGWQIWKRMGVVGFIGGAQVFNKSAEIQFNRFNIAVGGGLRILFNKVSKINLRIDYGFGLSKNSNGLGKRQSGLYFYLSEAF